MVNKKAIALKALMGAMFYCLKEVADLDAEFVDKIKDLNITISWDVKDGPKGFQNLEHGKVSFGIGEKIDNADLTINISDVDTAIQLLTGKTTMEEVPEKISMEPKEMADKLMFILEYLRKYFGGLLGDENGN